jgi:hypothetical protein
VIDDDRLAAIEQACEAPLGGVFEGREFEALVATCVDRNDGSEQSVFNFLDKCNALGMSAKQISKASWIRHDLMTYSAKAQEKARHDKCGKSALETFGPFNRNPVHEGKIKRETR